MEIYIKADQTIQQSKVDLMMNHLDKLFSKHSSIQKVKINVKDASSDSPMHRVRTVVKINGHNILCMVLGSDIYDTIANLIEKLERSILNFYQEHNATPVRSVASQAA